MHKDIRSYNSSLAAADKAVCRLLKMAIDAAIPAKDAKIWHGHPVWFISGNPIVGYSKLKDGVRLLFWSGQGFGEPGLRKEGSFKAAEARYADKSQVNLTDLRRWLRKSRVIQWDYKNIVKRRGRLVRLRAA